MIKQCMNVATNVVDILRRTTVAFFDRMWSQVKMLLHYSTATYQEWRVSGMPLPPPKYPQETAWYTPWAYYVYGYNGSINAGFLVEDLYDPTA